MDPQRIKGDYIHDIQKRVVFKKARNIATREISSHIDDSFQAKCLAGMEEEGAMRASVAEMGSADLVGRKLNKSYAPLGNLKVIVFVVLLLLLQGFSQAVGYTFSADSGFALIAGLLLFILIGITDYTFWVKNSKMLFIVLLSLSFITAAIDRFILSGGISHSLYPALLLPMVEVMGVTDHWLRNKNSMGWIAATGMAACLIGLVILSAPLCMLCCAATILSMVFEIRRSGKIGHRALFIMPVILFLLVIAFFIVLGNLNNRGAFDNAKINFNVQQEVKAILGSIKPIGRIDDRAVLNSINKMEHPILVMAATYGYMFPILLVMVVALLIVSFMRSLKQDKYIKPISYYLVTALVAASVLSGLTELGIVGPGLDMAFPCIYYGAGYTIYNFVILGFAFSINRFDCISNELLSARYNHSICYN